MSKRACRWAFAVAGSLGLAACSASSYEPPDVPSERGPGGGSSSVSSGNCNPSATGAVDASVAFNFDATADTSLGGGTVNPTTPPLGQTAVSGDATVTPTTTVDAGNPCAK